MNIRLLVVGVNGQLGNEIKRCIEQGKSEIGKIPIAYNNCIFDGVDINDLDITDNKAVRRFFNDNNYDIVINCASLTNVDACEEDIDGAFKVNVLGAKNLAIACDNKNAKLIQLSTDYVFGGVGVKTSTGDIIPYNEWDQCNPQNIYGKSKLMSEKIVAEFCKKYFVIRTSWLFGYIGTNFVKKIIELAKKNKIINVVNDQRGNPTNASDLVHHILKIALTEEFGLYHCTGNDICSWYEFACEIIKLSSIDCIVKPCTTQEFPCLAVRPAYSALNNLMLRNTIGDEMRPWKEALKMYMANLL